MVLDTVMLPGDGWYKNVLDQNATFEKSAENYFSWIARNDATYHLGTTRAAVEAKYYEGMDRLRTAPWTARSARPSTPRSSSSTSTAAPPGAATPRPWPTGCCAATPPA